MKTKVTKGRKGEELAVEFLEKQGYKIVEKNWRFSRLGEIDIIAEDGKTLVFIEVKARTSTNYGHPIEVISEKKFNTINKLAEIYLSNLKKNNYKGVRVDIIGILLSQNSEITHIKGVYS